MTTIAERFQKNLTDAVFSIPMRAASGFLFGYVYSKLADLPAIQAAKYWMISQVVVDSIAVLSMSMAEDNVKRDLIKRTVVVIGTTIFAIQMRKHELMGDKMMYLLLIMNTITSLIVTLLTVGIINKERRDPKFLPTDYWEVVLDLFLEKYAKIC